MDKILLCDDEDSLCRSLGRILRGNGYEVTAADGPGGIARIRKDHYDLILTDLRMPAVDGFEIIATARHFAPHTPVIAMSGSAEIPDAVRAMHAGARDFLIKPFDGKALEEVVGAILRPAKPDLETPDPAGWRDRYAPWMIGGDPALLPVLSLLSQVADTRCTVLITGQSGTGKELAARSLHAGSSRAGKPFVAVNSAAIPQHLVESDLFGHVKGAFTGAVSNRLGKFAQADGGTIFLDEIGEMEMTVQAKLLRLIQDGELCPVGDETPRKIDVRVLAATNRDLNHEVAAGRFRADLFWRLNVIPIEMPSLRSRATDIVRLAEHFLTRANEKHRRRVTAFEPNTLALMCAYTWPGNIRELENAVERMVIVKGSGALQPGDLPGCIRSPTHVGGASAVAAAGRVPVLPESGGDLKSILDAVEGQMIFEALERTHGNKHRAAELLGLNRTTLVEKLRRRQLAPQL